MSKLTTAQAIERLQNAADGATADQLLLRMIRRRPEWVSEEGHQHAQALRDRTCPGCGGPLAVTMRSHAAYCSGACKVRSWRKAKREENRADGEPAR